MTILRKLPLLAAVTLLIPAGQATASAIGGGEANAFAERQAAVLRDLASRYDPNYTGYLSGHRRNFGVHSTYLLAAIEVHQRGLNGGVSLAEAMPRIEQMLQHARDNLETWEGMPLNPGLRMASQVFPYIYHQWYDELSATAREDIRWLMIDSPWKDHVVYWLVNGSVFAGKLLVGEREGYDSLVWKEAVSELDYIYEKTMAIGGIELNAPIYSSYHYAPMAFLADKLEHDETRNKVRILLDYLLIVAGHQYIPGNDGGFVGLPRSRQREGVYHGSSRLPQHFYLFFGEPESNFASSFSPQMITAAANYRPPALIGSLFKEKPDTGYEFWTYTDSPYGTGRMGASKTYTLLPGDNRRISPWHSVVMPNGEGTIGIAYGHRGFTHHVSMGAWVRDAARNFHGIYHYHPVVRGDTFNNGSSLSGFEGAADDPDDWQDEGYDYERFLWGRTLLSIWDPTLDTKDSNVVRTHQDTRARIPNLARFGGEMIRNGRWYVGRMGDTYMAYFPLGRILVEETRGGGDWFYVRLDGRSGCIIEMATTEDFPSVQAYADDLAGRHLSMDLRPDNFHVVFDARDPETGGLVRLRLNYAPEARFIDGHEFTMQQYTQGFMNSPWVSWDADNKTKTLQKDGYGSIVYDVKAATITETSNINALLMMSESEVADGQHLPVNRAYVEFLNNSGYRAAVSTAYDTQGGPLTHSQMAELETFDLLIFPRAGAPDANFGHPSWNEVRTPILVHSPSLTNAGNWGWSTHTLTGSTQMERLKASHSAIDPAHPIFDNVLITDGQIQMFDQATSVFRTPMTYDGDGVTGELFGTTDEETPRVWVTSWSGQESAFSAGAAGEVPYRRTLFLWPAHPAQGHDTFTADGQQLLLNAANYTRRKPSRILMLVSEGHGQESSVRAMGQWIEEQRPSHYAIDYSADLSPDVLESATSLSAEQRALLDSYDLIIMPRIGAGTSGNFASTDWNRVTTPILSMNPFTYRPGTRWGWANTADSITDPSPWQMVVLDSASPLFSGVDTSDRTVQMYRDAGTITMTSLADSRLLTGNTLGWTDHEANGENLRYPWLTTWTGNEASFFEGGSEAPGGPRTLFLGANNNAIADYTDAGRQILLNVVDHTLAAGLSSPPPEPAGYGAWLEENFTEAERADENISGPSADPVGDGVQNAVRYSLGLPPRSPARDLLPEPTVRDVDVNGVQTQYLTLPVRRRGSLDEATLHVEVSRDLLDWTEPAVVVQEEVVEAGFTDLLYRDPEPIPGAQRSFLRLRVEWHEEK